MGNVIYDADTLTADEYLAAHPEINSNTDRALLTEVLYKALANGDPDTKVKLSNLLLDWGADAASPGPEGGTTLHALASLVKDPAKEAPLYQRLLDQGADPNKSAGRFGTPLEMLMYLPRFLETELAPIYDIWFTHPGLDFFTPDRNGHDLLDKVRRWRGTNPGLVERVERYIVEHGGTLPPNPYAAG
jgi:hypothetical protein